MLCVHFGLQTQIFSNPSLLGHFVGLFLKKNIYIFNEVVGYTSRTKANEQGLHMYQVTFYIHFQTHKWTPSHSHSVGNFLADSVWGLPYIKPSVSLGIHCSKCYCSWCITIRSTPKSPTQNHPYCLSETSVVPVHSTL